ncbi:MAG: hypothetical protein EOP78_08155 [Variovorax sp.]|nr:MAG: hypothetical protein EOP78_08155 [Variovorax sp.]
MKNHWIRIAAISVAMLGLSACSSESDSNRIHVETPFSIAKAGNKATLDFEATAEQATPGKNYMVSLTFDRKDGADPLSVVSGTPPGTLLPFNVRVVRLTDEGKEEPVELLDGSKFIGTIDPARYPAYMPQDPQAGIYYAFTYANTGDQGFLCLIRFNLKQAGRYRAVVETVQEQPLFADVPSVLIVQKHFNLGK